MRYGAGMKGKVGHALSYGLPIVTTSIGAEGFDFIDGTSCIIADDADAFAAGIIRIYEDAAVWKRLSDASVEILAPLGAARVAPQLEELLASVLAGGHGAGKDMRRTEVSIIASK